MDQNQVVDYIMFAPGATNPEMSGERDQIQPEKKKPLP